MKIPNVSGLNAGTNLEKITKDLQDRNILPSINAGEKTHGKKPLPEEGSSEQIDVEEINTFSLMMDQAFGEYSKDMQDLNNFVENGGKGEYTQGKELSKNFWHYHRYGETMGTGRGSNYDINNNGNLDYKTTTPGKEVREVWKYNEDGDVSQIATIREDETSYQIDTDFDGKTDFTIQKIQDEE